MKTIFRKFVTKSLDTFRTRTNKDILILVAIGVFVLFFSKVFHLTEYLLEITSNDYYWIYISSLQLFFILTIAAIVFSVRRIKDLKEAVQSKKKAEVQREKSKEQLQAVLDGVPDMILQVDTNMRILWANKAALQKNKTAIGKICFEAFQYERGTFIDAYCRWAMDAAQIEKGILNQSNILGIDGLSYWELIGVPLKNKQNQIYGAIAIAREITSRMRLEHTWNLLSSVVESTDDAIYGMSLTGQILYWNNGAEKIYGYDRNLMLGKTIDKLIMPLERENLLNIVEQVMRSEKVQNFEAKRITKSGEEIIASVTICPFVDATGRKIGVSSIEKDITEAKYAQIALLESENFNKTVISSVTEGVAVFDKNLRIKAWNGTMEILSGADTENAIGKGILEVFPSSKKIDINNMVERALKGNTVYFQNIFFETKVRHTGGWYNITYSPHLNVKNQIIGVVATLRDVTESKLAEQALAESEEKYRQLVENASEAIIHINSDGSILFVNEVISNLANVPSSDIVGKSIYSFLDTSGFDEVRKIFKEIFETGEKRVFDFSFPVSGAINYFFISAQPINDANGKVKSILCLSTNITERKIAEEALQESESRFRQMANTIRDAFWLLDWIEKKILFISPAYEKIWGRATDDLYQDSNNWHKYVHYEDSERVKKAHASINENGGMDEEYRIISSNGSIRWVRDRGFPIRTSEGIIYRVVGIAQDVTDIKNQQEELRKERDFAQSLIETAQAIVLVLDTQGKILLFNTYTESLTGYTLNEIRGKVWSEIFLNEKDKIHFNQKFPKTIEVEESQGNETNIITKNGDARLIQWHDKMMFDSEGKVFCMLAIGHDITEQKRAEDEIKASREQLRKLASHLESVRETERKEIAFEVHDELGQELTALKLDLSWLNMKMPQTEKKLIKKIHEMKDLIDMTIDRVGSISTRLRPDILDHFGLVAAIEWQTKELQKRASIRCRVKFIPNNDINVDNEKATVIFRILQETLTNVVRHAKATKVDVSFSEDKAHFELIVSDNGIGITQEDINAPDSFGLFAMNERARSVGGSVLIKGIPNHGTSIVLKIPKQ